MNAKHHKLRLPAAATTLVLTLFLAACGGGQAPAVSPSSADTTQATGTGSEALTVQSAPTSEQAAPAATTDTEDGSWKWTTGIKPSTNTYTLSVAKSGSGTVNSSLAGIACGTDCSEAYPSGTTVVLTAAPASGYAFKGWSGACAGTSLSCSVSMTTVRSVTATFESVPITYTLSISKSGSGTVTSSPPGISCGADCVEPYLSGTTVTLTAVPATGYGFKGWSGVCSGTASQCTLTVSGSNSVTATFETAPAPTEPAPTQPAVVGSEPIDAIIAAMPPNSWKALPATQMKYVCPAPYHSGACGSVVSAWSGAAYDEARDRMVVQGGGHGDSWYNNIFAFDLGPMKWRRLTEMGGGATGSVPGAGWTDKRVEPCGFYPKGPLTLPLDVMSGEYVAREKCFTEPVLSQLDLQQPRSAHTYGNLFVDKVRDRYCNVSRTFYPSSQTTSQVSVCYSPSTGIWSRIADHPNTGGQSALDANGNTWVFSSSQGVIAKYEPEANIWKTFGINNGDSAGGMDIDRARNNVFVVLPKVGGGHLIRRWDLNNTVSLSAIPNYSEINSTGDLPTSLGSKPGFVYVDALDQFFAWGGGRDVYTFNPATGAWRRFAASGDDPGAQQVNGTFGRFRYSPARRIFVLVNSTTQDVFIYKPAS